MMRKKNFRIISIFSCLLILFVIFSSERTESIVNKTVKNNTIDSVVFSIDSGLINSKVKYLSFYYHNPIGQGHPISFFEGSTKLFITSPTLFFESSDKQLPFLVYPGEKINIKYAGSDSVQFYIIGNEKRNNELNFFRELVLKTGNIYYAFKTMPYHKLVSTLDSIHLLEKKISEVKNNRLHMLQAISNQSLLSNDFVKIAANCIKSTAFTDSLYLLFSNRALLMKLNLYKNLILEKTESFKAIDFMPFQIYFLAGEAITSIATTGNPYYVVKDSSDVVEQFNFIQKHFTGPLKYFLMTRSLIMALTNDIPISQDYIQKYNMECKNEDYKKIVARKLNENKNVIYPRGSNSISSVDGKTVQDIKNVIIKNKGKVILLDFWASWCGPCRKEMPYSRKLKEKLKSKDVVFIYISVDEVKGEWLKANEQVGIGNDNSYLLLNSGNASFLDQYKISGVPRYLLIGKDGKMISDDAPQPHDPGLLQLITKHL